MAEVRVVEQKFSARHWSRTPHTYEEFAPGERIIPLRHESGYTVFARESDPVSRFVLEIDQFRAVTSSEGQSTVF